MSNARQRRCLIVERHEWETGFAQEQLQIPLRAAEEFFGEGTRSRAIRLRIRDATAREYSCKISGVLKDSGTRRIMGLDLVGLLGSCFLFFQETDKDGLYDFWVQYDKAIVAARFDNWQQAKKSQYGRGRLAIIVSVAVEKPIAAIARQSR